MAPPQAGNEILIPLFDAEALGSPTTVTWSQNLATRTALYYPLTVDNITTGEQFAFFIAAEFYKSSTSANPNHITRVGQLLPGEGYKLQIGSSLQYGQKNTQGDMRFVVYHDKERKPYQHRFIETALGSTAAKQAKAVAEKLGQGSIAGDISRLAANFVGDFLKTF